MSHITNEIIFPRNVLYSWNGGKTNDINSSFIKGNCYPNNHTIKAEQEMWNTYCFMPQSSGLDSALSLSPENTEQVVRGTKIHQL